MTPGAASRAPTDDLLALLEDFLLTLESEHKSPRTLRAYGDAVRFFAAWLEASGRPTQSQTVSRQDVKGYVTDLLHRFKPATAANRYRALVRFFGWAVDEGELAVSPMAGLRPPTVPETPPPVLGEDELRRLLRACEGPAFEDRRDNALFRCFIDTGARLSEVAGLAVADVDWEHRVLHVLGKGRRPRAAPFGAQTGVSLRRYLRSRASRRQAGTLALWLGHEGPMTPSGIADAVRRRGRVAGLPGLHPHLFRHTAAHHWQLEGGNETDLMTLLGWRSRSMLTRYAASAAAERARESHRRLGLGDRL
ncbi:MAG TPA: tyrosine-type recombinase/integrase [Candidatus Micrarchaeia archaeon]|nr:tyrosine-type recombinase/integrase [Candidatus Micrarchaeia archaeon]